jgi:HD-GYP domain-containing protein (c-di-GMP phosphodiesterase class II)
VTEGDAIRITISVGVTGGAGGSLRLDSLMHDADAATYAAKSLGRDQVYIFRATNDDELVHRAAISAGARKEALEVGRAALDAAQERLTGELESRAPWAGKPSLMIAKVAEAVARTAGLPEGEIARIRTASLLHDLGKLAIPEEILSKPGDLDEHEWRAVAEHPRIGQVILEQAGALRDAATIVVHHHEWFDGRGYPHGLSGRDIPVGSRIVSIADAYEAMVSGRPYREAMTHEEAVEELRRYSGVQFDPELVEVFVSIFGEGVPWPTSAPEVEAERRARLRRAIEAAQPEMAPSSLGETQMIGVALAATGTEG